MNDIRWRQRFENFDRALRLLEEALSVDINTRSDLEKEGIVQRFEFTFELAWKTLRDYMQSQGAAIDPVTPRRVIKQGFSMRVIGDGQTWIDMLEHRNQMSHTYDRRGFDAAVEAIANRYVHALTEFRGFLRAKEGKPWNSD